MNETSAGGIIGEALASIVLAGANAHRNAKARRAMKDLIFEAELARRREMEQRRAWLEAVTRQMARGSAGNGTMRDVHEAQRNPLDQRYFGARGLVRVPAGDQPTPFVFGAELQGNGTPTEPETAVSYDGVLPTILVGAMGAGKSTRGLTSFYMTARNQSIVAFCAKGTGPYQCGAERARFSYYGVINPGGTLGLKCDGFNPIARLHPSDRKFRRACLRIAEAIHNKEPGVGDHFRAGSVALFAGLIGDEVDLARREGRVPYLPNVRTRLCEPDRYEEYVDAAGRPARRLAGGISHTLRRIARSGHPAVRDLTTKFMREHGLNELSGFISTSDVQSRFLHDPEIMEMMRGRGVDLTHLCDVQSTVFVTISPEDFTEFAKVVRLVVATALQSHFRPGRYKTVFVLDEFRATVGDLQLVRDLWSTMREYKAQFLCCVTSILDLEAVWDKEWQKMQGQCGAIALLGAAPDLPTAQFFSQRSGNTTIAQLSYSENIGASDGGNTGAGFGQSVGGANTNQNSGRNAGASQGSSLNVTQTERAFLTPQQLMSLRPGEGRVWFPSMGQTSVPIFAPNYWMRRGDWVRAVHKNPYRGS